MKLKSIKYILSLDWARYIWSIIFSSKSLQNNSNNNNNLLITKPNSLASKSVFWFKYVMNAALTYYWIYLFLVLYIVIFLADNINILKNYKELKVIGEQVENSISSVFNSVSSLIDNSNIQEFTYNTLGSILTWTSNFFKPVEVHGRLDDLMGQQIAIYFILYFLTLSIILLLISYVLNNFLMLNKDKILNRFNNKYVKLYIKYQSFMISLSLI